MTIVKTPKFSKKFELLPGKVRQLFLKQEAIFENNWLDSRLHIKRLKEQPGVYSFRITRQYRALFYFADGGAVFFSVGHRKEIYRL